MAEFSAGKDTTIGHWKWPEFQTTKPLPTYPNGFGPEIIQEFEARIGRGTLEINLHPEQRSLQNWEMSMSLPGNQSLHIRR